MGMRITFKNRLFTALALMVLLALIMLSRQAFAATVITNGTFETGSLTGWTVSSGSLANQPANMSAVDFNKNGNYLLASGDSKERWSVVSGKLSLNQMIEDGDLYLLNKTVLSTANVIAQVDIRISEGASAGLRFRADAINVYSYGLLLSPNADEATLVKFPYTGAGSILATIPYTLNFNTDYTVKVESFDSGSDVRIKSYINGTLISDYTDVNQISTIPTYFQPRGAYVGVTANTAKATFDNLSVKKYSDSSTLLTESFSTASLTNYSFFPSNKTIIDDSFVGEINSNAFTINSNYILYRIGGKKDLAHEYVELIRVSDGAILYKETGGNSEYMALKSWDVSAYSGVSCYIKIVDSSSESREHLIVDDFVSADALPLSLDVSILEAQVGYHPDGVKSIYLRSAKATPSNNPTGKTFQIKNSSNTVVYTGTVASWGEKWGSYWWQLDFSAFTTAGTGYYAEVVDAAGNLTSSAFAINSKVLMNDHLVKVALDQLDARTQPGKLGWLDSSGEIRELTSIIIAEHALVDMYDNVYNDLAPATQTRLVNLISAGADYLVLAQQTTADPQTNGLFRHDAYVNPWGGYEVLSWHDATYAITALARAYQVTSNATYLNAAKKAYDMAITRNHTTGEMDYHGDGNGVTYTSRSARIEYYIPDDTWIIPTTLKTKEKLTFLWANTLMYGITGESKYKTLAISLANSVADLQFTDYNNPVDTAYGNFYEFEGYDNAFIKDWVQSYGIFLGYLEPTNLKGLMDLVTIAPTDPNIAKWYNVVLTYGENYIKKTAAINPLGIYPVAAYADPAYKGVKFFQSVAHGATSLYGMIAKNILEVGNFLNDASYQKLAENNVQFVAGLNPGMPNAVDETAWDARSLLKNIGVRSFQGFGGLSEAPDGSAINGFSAVDQFVQKDISLAPDAPKGILRTNGLLQFNEEYVPHSHGYVSGMVKLESPFKLQLATKNNAAAVAASVVVNLPEAHNYSINSSGSALITDLPTGKGGTVTVTYGAISITKPIGIVAGGSLSWTIDFANYVDITVTVPASISTGEAKLITVQLTNRGGSSAGGTLDLYAHGVNLSSATRSVSLTAGQTKTETFTITPGTQTMPYLVFARYSTSLNQVTGIGQGKVQKLDAPLLNDSFTDGDLAGWTAYGGTWTNTSSAAQVSVPSGDGYMLYDGPSASNFSYEGDLTLINSVAAGLLFRSNSTGTQRYDVIIDKVDGRIKLVSRPYSVIGSYNFTVNFNQAYHVKIVTSGTSIKVYLDGVLRIDATDGTYNSGIFGIFGNGGSSKIDTVVANRIKPVTGITLNKSSLSLTKGFKEALLATLAPTDAAVRGITWSSSDSTIASVAADGVVTAVREGKATITATTTDGSFQATSLVQVNLINENFQTDAFFMGHWQFIGGEWTDVPANVSMQGKSLKGFAFTVNDYVDETDFAYSAKVKITSGSTAGISFRMDGAGTMGYDVMLDRNDAGGTIKLASRPYVELGRYNFTVNLNQYYDIKVIAEKSNIRVFVDGVERIHVVDTQYSRGKFGLLVYNSIAQYDDVLATEVTLEDNFNDGDLAGWSSTGGTWSNTASAVLANTSSLVTGLLTNNASAGADFTYEGDMKLTSGDALALSFRMNAANTQGYDLILSRTEGRIKLATRPYAVIGDYTFTVNLNQVYHVKIMANGAHLQIYLDGVKRIDAVDASYANGKFGLLGYNSVGSFDNLRTALLSTLDVPSALTENFNDGNLSSWRVIGSGTWTNPSTYASATSTASGGELIYEDVVGENMQLSGDLKLVSGTAAGISFRMNNDGSNAYNVLIDKFDGGGIIKLAAKPYQVLGYYYLTVPYNTTIAVKIEADGPRIKVYMNNVLRIDVTDYKYSRGKYGLFSYNGTATFDNITVVEN